VCVVPARAGGDRDRVRSARPRRTAGLIDAESRTLPPLGELPEELLSRYDAVDLSLQADNGNPVHSADSVPRAKYL
jgi:hypothetical protein